ncbi:hypothetical protein GCM10023226_04940 [Nocardioides nanhaiensis]|uniref:Uncharacterized protein n=1 Tax=Nocardioides nanhaiensis TaxID=1476871 RepID=A0ABP8VV91_9ACTN
MSRRPLPDAGGCDGGGSDGGNDGADEGADDGAAAGGRFGGGPVGTPGGGAVGAAGIVREVQVAPSQNRSSPGCPPGSGYQPGLAMGSG